MSTSTLRATALAFGVTLSAATALPSFGEAISAAVLPTSRSAEVSTTVTAFATILAVGGVATQCAIVVNTPIDADFFYQTTDASNQPVGEPNTPVDVAAMQTFVIGFTPSSAFAPTEVELAFDCDNTPAAPTTPGVNTLLLSASDDPVPDVIALGATASEDGNLAIVGSAAAAFSVAAANVGIGGDVEVSADTGTVNLPVQLAMCETEPTSGACTNPTLPTATVSTTIAANGSATFSVFATASDDIPFDPASHRIAVRFVDAGGVTRGSTSVSLQAFTQTATLSWDAPTQNVDGSPLTDLTGYKLYWGQQSRNYSETLELDAEATDYELSVTGPGTWFFAITSVNSSGTESTYSNEVSKSF